MSSDAAPGPSRPRSIIDSPIFKNHLAKETAYYSSEDENITGNYDQTKSDDSSSDNEPLYPSFGSLHPRYHTLTDIYPGYPETHIKGHATIIGLPESVSTNERIQLLLKGLQYSLSNQGGGGKRIRERVPFFDSQSVSDDEEDNATPMYYHSRTCAGVKVCEHFPMDLRKSHTAVDDEGLEWARLLAEQERTHTNIAESKVDKLYDEYINDLCDRSKHTGISTCKGKTVIRSRGDDISSSLYHRLFIGCENWQPNEKGHTRISLDGCDPAAVLKRWGRNRCYVHRDILEKLNIVWDNIDGIVVYIFTRANCKSLKYLVVMLFIPICKEERINDVCSNILL